MFSLSFGNLYILSWKVFQRRGERNLSNNVMQEERKFRGIERDPFLHLRPHPMSGLATLSSSNSVLSSVIIRYVIVKLISAPVTFQLT